MPNTSTRAEPKASALPVLIRGTPGDADQHQDRAEQVGRLAAPAVGQRAEHAVEHGGDDGGDEDPHEHVRPREPDLGGGVGDEVGHADVGEHALAQVDAGNQEDLPRVAAEGFAMGILTSTAASRTFSNSGLSAMLSRMNRPTRTRTALNRNGSRHPQDSNWARRQLGHQEERDGGQADPGRRAHLRESAEEAAAPGRRVLHRHQGGAAPFTADREALKEPQDGEQDRRRQPDHGVAGHQTHQGRRDTHHDQGDDQHLLASDAVTEVAEHDTADRTGQEAHAEGGEGQQCPDQRAGVREEQLGEDQGGCGAVDEEVVVLDRWCR